MVAILVPAYAWYGVKLLYRCTIKQNIKHVYVIVLEQYIHILHIHAYS